MLGLDKSFIPVRSILRSLIICALLVFAHVLLVTMAVAPRELFEAYPELAGSVKVCSALTFLTLLWTIFTLFELADLASPVLARSTTRSGNGGYASEEVEEIEEGGSEAHNVYTMTWVELFVGTIAVIGWAYCAPHAIAIFRILSAKLVSELVLLPLSYGIAVISLVFSQLQLIFQLCRLSRTRASGTKIWTARTGHWETRVKLDQAIVEKV